MATDSSQIVGPKIGLIANEHGLPSYITSCISC